MRARKIASARTPHLKTTPATNLSTPISRPSPKPQAEESLPVSLLTLAAMIRTRSSCRHCFLWIERLGKCAHDWPDEGQRRWPIDAPDPVTGERPTEAAFCKEFELA